MAEVAEDVHSCAHPDWIMIPADLHRRPDNPDAADLPEASTLVHFPDQRENVSLEQVDCPIAAASTGCHPPAAHLESACWVAAATHVAASGQLHRVTFVHAGTLLCTCPLMVCPHPSAPCPNVEREPFENH
jgi:hypothetical protein